MAAQLRIGLMLDLDWPYKRHAEVFAGTQQYAEENDWHSIIDEYAHETLAECTKKSKPYDGMIARANSPLVKQAKRLQIPLVNVWSSSPAHNILPCVFPDYTSIGQQSADHLVSRGFRNFATLTPPNSPAQEKVVQAFVRTVKEAGFACTQAHILQNTTENISSWRKALQTLQHCAASWQTPIGIYVAQENVGRMVVQMCHERGLRVPADVAIIAGQNEEIMCEHPRPSLTSLELGFKRVGYQAAALLHRLLEGKAPPTRPILIPPVGVVVRESTDFFAVDDELVSAALSYISANSHRPIGQDDVAAAVSTGTRTLQNRFNKYLHRPIATEIRRVRIERAKRELSQSKRTMQEIARDVGFGEAMRMYEIFCRELGLSPSEYRKKIQAQTDMPE